DYVKTADNPATLQEDTHLNKFGAFLMAAKLCEDMLIYITHDITKNGAENFQPLKDAIKLAPSDTVQPPAPLLAREDVFKKYFKYAVMPGNETDIQQ
ncbi:MAG: hypothetical protein IJL89_10965, partial [Firmicutes bacterium]|nr:hypothetical protein [Bacillota bacterium]